MTVRLAHLDTGYPMTSKSEQLLALPSPAPGTQRHLRVVRYGDANARPKIYMQAAVHANELPGALALHVLENLLDQYAQEDALRGQIMLVPLANPIGLAQMVQSAHLGRAELTTGKNFNRSYPALTENVAAGLEGRLGEYAAANITVIRSALLDALATRTARDEGDALRLMLMSLAIDADVCLDLHCASEALMHMYTAPVLWPAAAELAAQMHVEAVMLETESGGDPFDEAISRPWSELAARFPQADIPNACLSCTLELRGHSDVDLRLAHHDANNLVRFLMRRGVVRGDPGELPPLRAKPTPLSGVEYVRANSAGIIGFMVDLGTEIHPGQHVATVINSYATGSAAAVKIHAQREGLVYARSRGRFAQAGTLLVTIAGRDGEPSRTGSTMLSD